MENFVISDFVILGVMGISIIVGVMRGFFTELISLITWIASFWIAGQFMDLAAVHLEPYISNLSMRLVAGFGVVFLGVLFVGGMLNILINTLLRKAKLNGMDRLLGIIFGGARGAVLVSIAVMILRSTPITQTKFWTESELIPTFELFAQEGWKLLPSEVTEKIDISRVLNDEHINTAPAGTTVIPQVVPSNRQAPATRQ